MSERKTREYAARVEKYKDRDYAILKAFLKFAPVGYDILTEYRNWQFAKLDNPGYSGIKGVLKFISDPVSAGVARANGIEKVKNHNNKNPNLNFTESFNELRDSTASDKKEAGEETVEEFNDKILDNLVKSDMDEAKNLQMKYQTDKVKDYNKKKVSELNKEESLQEFMSRMDSENRV